MELPRSRIFEAEGRKPTHDFLSLYSQSTLRQDPRSPSQADKYLETHDFLQPLERVGRSNASKEETSVEISSFESHPPVATPPSSMEHNLPGGIGTYTISHISHFNQRAPKSEGITTLPAIQASSSEKNDENSNCSSYSGSGFTLWEESSVMKGKTGKESIGDRPILREAAVKVGQWTTSERPLKSSTSNHRNSFSSLSSSQAQMQKSQSFIEMMKSAKSNIQDDDLDDEHEFLIKKESSSIQTGDLRVKEEGKNIGDQKPNTPRSKHSATEQRRRSKINDRFQTLRELIPFNDQKRDKASFLLEVIEYIQFLQEKVHKYEGSYQGWNPETKVMPLKNNHRAPDSYADQSRGINGGSGPPLVFASRLDEKNTIISPTLSASVRNPIESDINSATTLNIMDHRTGLVNKPMSIPMSFQPNYFSPARVGGGAAAQLPTRLAFNEDTTASQLQPQSCHSRSSTCDGAIAIASDKMKEKETKIEGGAISISSVYSEGILNTLTQALQRSGVDLSQSNISVQIELGKRVHNKTTASTSVDKNIYSQNNTLCRRVEDSEQAKKKLKTMSKPQG